MEIILTELVMADLEIVSRRIDSIKKGLRVGKKDTSKGELDLLDEIHQALSSGRCLIDADIACEANLMKAWGILTAKPYVVVANIGEDDVEDGSEELHRLQQWGEGKGIAVVPVCTKFELEASELDEQERREFLESVGIISSGTDILISTCYDLLDLLTFYTPVGKVLTAWTLKKGETMHEAAGLIHTDIQKGFIKADVIALSDFLKHGGLSGAREAGAILTEGREFVLRDLDVVVIHFR